MAAVRNGSMPYHDSISCADNEIVVFATDYLTHPPGAAYWRKLDPYAHLRTARALAIAKNDDLVVISGKLNMSYYSWLRSLGLGPFHVVDYGQDETDKALTDLILENPERLRSVIRETGKKPVLVPSYSSQKEVECASVLGAELFGCDEEITLKFFNKVSFKEQCRELGIPVVEGSEHAMQEGCTLNYTELERLVRGLLSSYQRVLIRGDQSGAGSSIYVTDNENVQELYQEIKKERQDKVLVEPFLSVITSPNDQWAISREGEIGHIGLSAQLFEGLKFVGSLQGQYISERIADYISETSLKIVQHMASHGYRGVVGVDYIVCEEGIFPIENNARVNGSTYTYGIIDRVQDKIGPVRYWKFFKARTTPCSFEGLMERINRFAYDGKRANSVFPYDVETLPHNGTFAAVLLAEDMYHIRYLEESLRCMDVMRVE